MMNILHLRNDTGVPYHYVNMLRREGVDAELLFDEEHCQAHPLWELLETDLGSIPEGSEDKYYPKDWIDRHRDEMPDWVQAIPYDGEGSPASRKSNPSFILQMVRRLHSSDCDLVHAWTIHGAIWASLSGKRYIYHITGFNDWCNFEGEADAWSPRRLAGRVLGNRAIRNAEEVITASQGIVDDVENAHDLTPKLLKHTIDTEYFKPAPANTSFREQYEGEVLLFAGARHDWDMKRNDQMFKSLTEVAEPSRYHIVTAEWGTDLDKSKELVDSLGLEEQVTFVPLLSRAKLRMVLNSVDGVLDQFSRELSFGTLATQTLATGTPLLSGFNEAQDLGFEVSESPPVLDGYSPAEIADNLQRLADPEYRDTVGERSRTWMENNYNGNEIIQEYIRLYEDILYGN